MLGVFRCKVCNGTGRLVEAPSAASQPATQNTTSPTGAAATSSSPSETPQSQPLTQPASATATESQPATNPAAPASPEELAKAVPHKPIHPSEDIPDWDRLPSAQQAQAEQRYREALQQWQQRTDYRGKKVSWKLSLDELSLDKAKGVWVVVASSADGHTVRARLAENGEFTVALKKGAVQIRGTIRDYVFDKKKDRLFEAPAGSHDVELDEATLEPAPQSAGQQASPRREAGDLPASP